MLGTLLLVAMIALGFMEASPWLILPASIAAAFIGLHHQPGKAEMAQARGYYWKVILGTIPVQAIFMAVLYGVGWGIGYLAD